MDHTLSTKIAKFTSLENLYEYGIINCDVGVGGIDKYHITVFKIKILRYN